MLRALGITGGRDYGSDQGGDRFSSLARRWKIKEAENWAWQYDSVWCCDAIAEHIYVLVNSGV